MEQERILQVLDAKKVNHETVDVANNRTRLRRMRQMCENMEALPPQIFKGNKYLGVSRHCALHLPPTAFFPV